MTEKSEYIKTVESCIGELVKKFTDQPYMFYTEQDTHCYLYHLLYKEKLFAKKYSTNDSKETVLLHKEYPPIDKENRRRREAFDIVVLNPASINTIDASKKFRIKREPITPLIAIELALDYGTDHLKKDYAKLAKENNVKNAYILHFIRDINIERHIRIAKQRKRKTKFSDLLKEVDSRKDKERKIKIWYVDVYASARGIGEVDEIKSVGL